jgi:hypothetical protein
MPGWDRYRLLKKRNGTRYAKLMFLYPVGSPGHVVQSGVSTVRNIDALFFKLKWDRYGFEKKCDKTRYAELLFLYPMGSVDHVVHFGESGS